MTDTWASSSWEAEGEEGAGAGCKDPMWTAKGSCEGHTDPLIKADRWLTGRSYGCQCFPSSGKRTAVVAGECGCRKRKQVSGQPFADSFELEQVVEEVNRQSPDTGMLVGN